MGALTSDVDASLVHCILPSALGYLAAVVGPIEKEAAAIGCRAELRVAGEPQCHSRFEFMALVIEACYFTSIFVTGAIVGCERDCVSE